MAIRLRKNLAFLKNKGCTKYQENNFRKRNYLFFYTPNPIPKQIKYKSPVQAYAIANQRKANAKLRDEILLSAKCVNPVSYIVRTLIFLIKGFS